MVLGAELLGIVSWELEPLIVVAGIRDLGLTTVG
jgi:hypothetical protein